MPVLHGKNDTLGDYESSAFFIRHDPSGQEFLFFGDVSPDSLASKPQTIAVWRAAAPKIPSTLSAIFIECSWPSGRSDELLYGHLTPEHLVDELTVLAEQVKVTTALATVKADETATTTTTTTTTTGLFPKRKKRRRNKSQDTPSTSSSLSEPLAGLRVYIMHCKDDLEGKYSRPISHVIRDQVDALVRAKGLGAEVLSAEQGMSISTYFGHFWRALR
jgi:3',5'-cyclic-nucleotide phosphodiesterase